MNSCECWGQCNFRYIDSLIRIRIRLWFILHVANLAKDEFVSDLFYCQLLFVTTATIAPYR